MSIRACCPACGEESSHQVLREAADLLVQCGACGHIYHMPREKEPEPINVKTVISAESQSRLGVIDLLPDEKISLGDMLVAELDDETAVGVEVTAIEVGAKRPIIAAASEIDTLWTRAIEGVVVKASVHNGRITIPLYQKCDGEEEFAVDGVYDFAGKKIRISHIKLRDGPILRKEGWKAFARRIKRIYGTYVRY
jgi:uncharacterized Zn finger protein